MVGRGVGRRGRKGRQGKQAEEVWETVGSRKQWLHLPMEMMSEQLQASTEQ